MISGMINVTRHKFDRRSRNLRKGERGGGVGARITKVQRASVDSVKPWGGGGGKG